MKTSDIRSAFLRFFEEKGHTIVPSDRLVPEHDPTLLFTGAGMNQFKDQFLGKNLTYRRAASCQKCFRADDIDKVGRTPCHHTFFEMLGNFSFGDYFKQGAIEYAWEFLVDRLKLSEAKLSVSVYKDDDESYGVWRDVIGLPSAKILRLGEHDNFWPADAPSQSPEGTLCGPCTEIFYDMGPQPHCPDPANCNITCECKRHVEIWNLVLQQYEKGASPGELRPLSMQNIDTGMGLERTAAVMQGVLSDFDIDIFKPVVDEVRRHVLRTTAAVPDLEARTSCVRRIADHVRAVAFLIAENVLPGNEKRGYVVRRLIRRAMRDGLELGASEPFLYALVPAVARAMRDAYPELEQRRENIARVIQAEEERFHATLEKGSRLLDELRANLVARGLRVLPGAEAFRLYDTYGFPLELTESILESSGISVDRAGFEKEMDRQRAQARRASSMVGEAFDTGPLGRVKEVAAPTRFLGYGIDGGSAPVQSRVAAIIKNDDLADEVEVGDEATVVLDETPFYGEAGGQIGDTGTISASSGRFDVLDTGRAHGYFLHIGKVASGRIQRGQTVSCEVDIARRRAIARAHTATHLLHHALRTVLGKHVEQAGSLVAPDRLRFDFSHFAAVTPDELERIEELVNEHILGAADVAVREMPIDKAKALGAIALFGEKYGETVRVVDIGGYSVELCGGTHLRSAAQVGPFRIVSESSVAAGTRRIEAVTGSEAIGYGRRREAILERIAAELGGDEGRVLDRVQKLQNEVRELRAEVKKLRQRGSGESADDIIADATVVGGAKLVVRRTSLRMNDLRELCDALKRKLGSGVVVLASDEGGKASFVVGVTKDLTPRLDAGRIVKEVAAAAGGSGGGRSDMAQAGAKDASKIDDALATAPDVIARHQS